MISSQFREFVSSVKKRLLKDVFPNEASVSMSIVLPVLEHLGWDIRDPSYVYPEYPLEGRKVDYGLKVAQGKNEGLRCIIEVKAVGNIADADRQLFEYAFHAGTPLAVLTDGKLWKFYLPLAAGQYKERLVRTLDFEEHLTEELVEGLVRYISFDNTRSGQAKRNAESDLDELINKVKAKKNISNAWQSLLDGTSDKLVNLLIEETSLTSSAPERSDVEKFLSNLKTPEQKPELLSRKKPPKPEPEKPKKRETSFILLGEGYTEKTMKDAFAKIMEILAVRDKDFLSRLASSLPAGKSRKWLSQNRAGLGRHEWVRAASRKLPGGWFLNTHSSTDMKIKILRKACEVAGIPFGKPRGLKIPS